MSAQSKALVIGAGLSGKGAALLLLKQGFQVHLYDDKALSPQDQQFWQERQVELKTPTNFKPDDLARYQEIVISPGVKPTHPLILTLKTQHRPLVSELEIGLRGFAGKIIGITGTNGKSTTTMMVEHLLKSYQQSALAAGNIGDPPSLIAFEDRVPATYALELSSYQLEYFPHLKADIAIFHNFSFDHLERHGSIDNYFRCKWQLVQHAKTLAIITRDIYAKARSLNLEMPPAHKLSVIGTDFDEHVEALPQPPLYLHQDGRFQHQSSTINLERYGLSYHNILNGVVATLAANALLQKKFEDVFAQLAQFKGLPFRFEKVAEFRGYPVINDSKATNVDATLTALQNITSSEKVLLLLGGQGKGESFAPVAKYAPRIAEVLAFGASGGQVHADLAPLLPCRQFATLRAAIPEIAATLHRHPRTLLFSPACASFDEFKNFEDRGQFFTQSIREALARLPL